jgi:hypothetical protein
LFAIPAVLSPERLSVSERERFRVAGAFECFALSTPVDTLSGHIRSLIETTWTKRKLRLLLERERENVLYEEKSAKPDQYLKEKLNALERHAKILEDYKKQTEAYLLILEVQTGSFSLQQSPTV